MSSSRTCPVTLVIANLVDDLREHMAKVRRGRRWSVTFDVAYAVDDLRQLIAKADALAHAAEDLSDDVIRVEDGEACRRRERLAHLIGAIVLAVQAALKAGDQLAIELSTHRAGA